MNLATALQFASTCVVDSEGFSSKAYLDTIAKPPVWTIGHGTTLIDDKPVCEGMTCTIKQANTWAARNMLQAATVVQRYVTVPLSECQLGALVSFCYNIGAGAFERSDVLKALNLGMYQAAADRMLEYDHAGPVRVPGLTTRRARERALFLRTPLKPTFPTSAPEPAHPNADDLNQTEIDKLHQETIVP